MHLGLERGREIRGIFAAFGGENPTNFYSFFTTRYMKRDVSVNQSNRKEYQHQDDKNGDTFPKR